MPAARALAAISGLALALTACTSGTHSLQVHSEVPREGLIPSDAAVTRVEELSGEYCYFGPDFDVRSYLRSPDKIPFVDIGVLGEPTKVTVEASAERILFAYTNDDGVETQEVFTPAEFGALWQENVLVIPWGRSKSRFFVIPFLFWHISSSGRESRLFKLTDGRLVMSDSFGEGGFTEQGQSDVFFSRKEAVAVILDPSTGDCAADALGRPRQLWFERGLDFRDPACAVQLEKQLAAILIDQGETLETGTKLANETVETLSRGEGDSKSFSVSDFAGPRYSLELARKRSGCVLRLWKREKHNSSYTNRLWYIAKRPLPDCACNP